MDSGQMLSLASLPTQLFARPFVRGAGHSESCCLCGGDRFLLAPGSPCSHSGLARLGTHSAVETLNKSAPYLHVATVAADLMTVGIDVRVPGKARRGVILTMRRQDKCEQINQALETDVPERA